MIELFSSDTPNGKKIGIMLEEIGIGYKVTKLDLGKKDQFKAEFRKISPFSKIPVIKDHSNNEIIFESGAILIYLGEKSNKFYDQKERLNINGKTYEALRFNFSSSDKNLPEKKKLNTDIWYDEKTNLWLKASFDKTGHWEYRLKKYN